MAKKQIDDDSKKDSFVIYKEWEMLISPLSDTDRLRFFDLLMGWDFIKIPDVESRHLQSIITFIFGKVAENREKYLERCKSNSEAAKARWDEYKRLKALAMQTDANAYERIKMHVNAMPNENDNEHVNENVNDNDIPSKEGGSERPPRFDFDGQKWSKEFQEVYGKAGKPRPTDTAFAQCLIRMESEFSSHKEAFQMLKTRAAQHRTYHIRAGTETRFIPEPQNWLDADSWKIDWNQKTQEYKTENKTAKGGLSNGKSSQQEYADAARQHARDSGL